MRHLGLDYGKRTVGVAVSDGNNLMALPLETIFRDRELKLRKTLARIETLVKEYEITVVVVGLPLNMDDTEGERCRKTREFIRVLEDRLGDEVKVVTCDERLSTFEAEEILNEAGISGRDRKQHVDKIAAGFILQRYLDEVKNDGSFNL